METWIRETNASDGKRVSDLVVAAFGPAEGPEIARLVASLQKDPTAQPSLSLVSEADDETIAGHVLFTKVGVDDSGRTVASILCPLAVGPGFQGQGIGGRLIREGLERSKAAGVELVFVLGDPRYYRRHGFRPAGERGLQAPYPIRPEVADAWMVQELHPGVLGRVRGRIVCSDALDDPRHWQEG